MMNSEDFSREFKSEESVTVGFLLNMEERETFSESLQRFLENTSGEFELWSFTETLLSDLEICRNENKKLRKELTDLLNKDDSLSQLHLELQEENLAVKEENKALKFKLKAQQLQFESEKSEIGTKWEMKIRNSEEEIRKLKQILSQKEREFFEELQMAQATAAYEFEKIEKKLKWQLSETNKQLCESNLINSKLLVQLENTHIENIRVGPSDELKKKTLEMSPARLTETPKGYVIGASNCSKLDISKKIELQNNNCDLKEYEPLQIERCSGTEKDFAKPMPPLFKGKSRAPKKIASCSPKVPPLIPCSNAAPVTQKKRRLHDPDDLSYLVNLIPDGD